MLDSQLSLWQHSNSIGLFIIISQQVIPP